VTSISTCLATSFSVVGGMGTGVGCGDALTDFDIPALDSIEETIVFGTLSVGSYTAQTTFDVPGLSDAMTTFVVQ